jgi:hypothetical protein
MRQVRFGAVAANEATGRKRRRIRESFKESRIGEV